MAVFTYFLVEWEYLGNILSGYHFVDPSLFRHDNKWWLFVSNTQNDILNLYYSDRVKTSWHSMKSCKFHNNNEKQVC